MATNRIETLDPALIRPGRIDRKIEFPLPDAKTKRRIFGIHTGRMTLSEDVNLEEFVMAKDELSGADIKVTFPLPFCRVCLNDGGSMAHPITEGRRDTNGSCGALPPTAMCHPLLSSCQMPYA